MHGEASGCVVHATCPWLAAKTSTTTPRAGLRVAVGTALTARPPAQIRT